MKSTWKAWLSALFYFLGVLGWCYVGGWMILTGPLREILEAYAADSLSLVKLCMAIVHAFFYLSLAGGVWCIGYILGNYFKEH